jgi:ubiquinone/menaquinone biosynthesis C-methylase UbiE
MVQSETNTMNTMVRDHAKTAHIDIITKRYQIEAFNVVHPIAKSTLIENLSHVLDPAEVSGKTVLEIGAGCSNYLALFLELGVGQLLANDIVQKRLELNNISDPRYISIPGDFLELSLSESVADIIFAHLTFMFLVPLFDPMFKKVFRVLKPGGLLITIDPNYSCPISLWRLIRGRSDTNPERLFSPFRFAKGAKENGFVVERLVPFTSNHGRATGHWPLGTCFGMRASKPAAPFR